MAEEEEEDEFTILAGSREENRLNEDPRNEIEENARQFANVFLQINLIENDIRELTNDIAAVYTSEPITGRPEVNDGTTTNNEFRIVSYHDENPYSESNSKGLHVLDLSVFSSDQLKNTTDIEDTKNIVNNEIVSIEHFEEIKSTSTFLSRGLKVVEAAVIDFDQDVKETDIVFPKTKSFTGPKIDEYLTNIACTPGSAPWNIGAVATWFKTAEAGLPTGMTPTATGDKAKYQRSTAQGWYNWALNTKRLSKTPLIGSAVLIGKSVLKKGTKNPIVTATSVVGIIQHITNKGEIVVLGAEPYKIDRYAVSPTEAEIKTEIANTPSTELDDKILKFAAAFITCHEGFIPFAMWDCQNWRIGVGSGRICLKNPNTPNGKPAIRINLPGDYSRQPIAWLNADRTATNGVYFKFKEIGNTAVTPGPEPNPSNNPMVYPLYPTTQKGPPWATASLDDNAGPKAGQHPINTMWCPETCRGKVDPALVLITKEEALLDLEIRLEENLAALKTTSPTAAGKFTEAELLYIQTKHPYWLATLIDVQYCGGPGFLINNGFIKYAKKAAKADNPDIFYRHLTGETVDNGRKKDAHYIGREPRAEAERSLASGKYLTSENPFRGKFKKDEWPKEITQPVNPNDVVNVDEYMKNFYFTHPLIGMRLKQSTVNPTEIIGYVVAANEEEVTGLINLNRNIVTGSAGDPNQPVNVA